MKRSVLFTAVAALFLTASCAGTVTPTKREPSIRQGWDNEEHKSLYGDVESVTITDYKLADKFGEVIKVGIEDKRVYKFNLKGDVVAYSHYKGNDSLDDKLLYKYDSQGNWIEKACYMGEIMKPVSMVERVIAYRK